MKNYKKILLLLLAILSIGNALAIDQIGIAYRYNGKKQRTPLGGVYVKVATSPNGVVSQEQNGQFVLKLKDIKMGDAVGNAIVQKTGMMVFNKEEVNRWHVQKDALVLIVSDADAFQKQKERLIAIGRNQAEKKYKQKIELLKTQNAKQQLNLDKYYAKLDSIEKERNNALAHMEEYADMFARIDESEIDTLAQRAIELFNQGQLEESIKLFEQGNYLEKLDDALKIKAQAADLRQKADSAETLANKDIEEHTKSIQAQVAAYKMKNEWDKAGELLKGLADRLQTLDAIFDYANFALSQNMFTEAKNGYELYIKKILSDTNPQAYESDLAKGYNNLALVYYKIKQFNDAERMYKSALEIQKRTVKNNQQIYELDLAISYNNLTNLYHKLNRFNESEIMGKFALEIFKHLAEVSPQMYGLGLFSTYNNLALLYSDINRFDEAEQMFKEALEICKRLATANPQAYKPYLAKSYIYLANLYRVTQRFKETEQMNKSALEIYKRLANTNTQAYEPDLARSYNDLANLYYSTQRFNEAEQMHKSALEIYKRLAKISPQTYEPDLAMSYNNFASLYSNTQRFNEAEQMYKAALEIRKRLADANPQAYEPNLAMSYNNLANLYRDTQRFNEAEQMHKAALEIRKRLADANPQAYEPNLAMSYNNLAILYSDTQHFNEAEQMYKDALEIRKRLAEANPQAYELCLAQSYNNLANLYYSTQRFNEAEHMYKTAIDIHKRLAEANPQAYELYLAQSYNNLANLYYSTQRFYEAEHMYKVALEIHKRLADSNPQLYNKEQAECLFWLADSRIKQEKYSEAIAPLEKALDFYKKEAENVISIDYYNTIISWLYQLYSQEKKYSQAYHCFKQNIPTLRTLYLSDKSNYAKLLNGILICQSFYSIFEKLYAEAEAYSKEALEVNSTNHIAYSNLAAALLFQGKYQEAEKIYLQYKPEQKEGFLSDFEEFSKAGVIPKSREEDVEKIKKILKEE